MGTSAGTDALLLVLGVAACLLTVLAALLVRELRPTRPCLPDDDRPPAGLGRLLPVGGQVDSEVRRGLLALDLWLRHRPTRP